jgi:hypothetical protein
MPKPETECCLSAVTTFDVRDGDVWALSDLVRLGKVVTVVDGLSLLQGVIPAKGFFRRATRLNHVSERREVIVFIGLADQMSEPATPGLLDAALAGGCDGVMPGAWHVERRPAPVQST